MRIPFLGRLIGLRPQPKRSNSARRMDRKGNKRYLIWDNCCFTLDACKSGKGERWHWKPSVVGHWDSLSNVRWKEGVLYEVTHFTVPMQVQVFFLWFVVSLKIKREFQSKREMVHRNDTILSDKGCAAVNNKPAVPEPYRPRHAFRRD